MKLNLKANEKVTVYDKLEYVTYDNKEKFILSGRALGIEEEDNRAYDFASIFLKLLNLSDNDFQNLGDHIGILKSVITKKPYNVENAIIFKTKMYINDINSKKLIDKYEIFKISCELGYFKMVESYQRYDFKNIDNTKNANLKKYSSDNLNYIYKCYKENKIKALTAYKIEEFEDFIVASLSEIFEKKKTIKKCENCGKYFIPKRSDAFYCDNPSPQNETKLCKDYAPANKSKDEAYNTYRRIYKSLKGKIDYYSKPGDEILHQQYEETFNRFIEENTEKKKQFENGDITKEEYLEWLKEQ